MAKEDKYEHIDKYEQLKKHKEAIVETTKRHHAEAYFHAVDQVLKEKGKKHPDYEKLKVSDIQQKFADKMADFYLDKAKEYFQVHGDLGDLEKDMMLNAYVGVTKPMLHQLVSKYEDKFTLDKHQEESSELVKELNQKLSSSTRAHFKESHIKDLLSKSGADRYVQAEYITLPEAVMLYDVSKLHGTLSKKIIEQSIPNFDKRKFKKEVK